MTPDAIVAGFMLGTARQPLRLDGALASGIAADDPAAALSLLALAGQALRFTRPSAPPAFDDVARVTDTRRILSPQARRLLLRLVTGKGASADDAAARAVAHAIARLRLRPHPFDLPRLGGFVRKFAELLGPAALEWATRGDGDARPTGYFDADEIGPDTWTLATPARKAGYIAGLRKTDPAHARTLIAAQLVNERAEARVRLISTLVIGLGADDRALLESLAADRAPRVKDIALRLLARLPGTAAAEARIADIVSRIATAKTGMLRRRTTLKLQLPANIREHQAPAWLAETFSAVGLGQIADALGLPPADLVEAARDDRHLPVGLAFAACIDRHFDELRTICAGPLPDGWTTFLDQGLEAFGLADAADRAAWASATLNPAAWQMMPGAWQAEALQQQLVDGLPPAVAAELLDSPAWRGGTQGAGTQGEWVTPIAALIPAALLPRLRERLAALPPETNGRALLLTELLSLLERHANEDPA